MKPMKPTTHPAHYPRLLPAQEKQCLFVNMSGPLSQVGAEIEARRLGHLAKADAA